MIGKRSAERTALAKRRGALARTEAGPAQSPAGDGLIPMTREGMVDLVALREGGDGWRADAYERRFRAVSTVRGRLASAAHGERSAAWQRTAAELGCSASALRTWERGLRDHGPVGLVPTRGLSRKGGHPGIDPELGRQILDAYAHGTRYSVRQIADRIVRPWCEEHGTNVPHIRTLQRFLADPRVLPPLVNDFARLGPRLYREKHVPRVRRVLTPDAVEVGAWFCSDHRKADCLVLVADGEGRGWPRYGRLPCPCGSGEQRRHCCSAKRPWWTTTVDIATGAIVGFRVSTQPDAAVVCGSLRDAILDFGLPRYWLRDHGRDFCARRLAGPTLNLREPPAEDVEGAVRWPAAMPAHVEDSTLWEALGVRVVTTIPYSAWSKPIESIFGAFAARYENALPGWCGRSTDERPEKLDGEKRRGELLTIGEYAEGMARAIADWNTLRPIGERDKPPLDYFTSPDYVRREVSDAALAFLLQDRKELSVRGGLVRLGGRAYLSEELSWLSGSRVQVRYDPGRPDVVWVYPGDGRCLAVRELPPAKYGEWGEANLRTKQAAKAQRRGLRNWAVAIKGCCPGDSMDFLGAHAVVRERLATQRAAEGQAGRQAKALLAAADQNAEEDRPDVYEVADAEFRAEYGGPFEADAQDAAEGEATDADEALLNDALGQLRTLARMEALPGVNARSLRSVAEGVRAQLSGLESRAAYWELDNEDQKLLMHWQLWCCEDGRDGDVRSREKALTA